VQILLKICRSLAGKPSTEQQQQQGRNLSAHQTSAAAYLLVLFFNKASDGSDVPQDLTKTNPLKDELLSQVHQSGLLQRLPLLLETTADAMAARMQSHTPAASHDNGNSSSSSSSSASSNSSGSRTSSSNGGSATFYDCLPDEFLIRLVKYLLLIHKKFHQLLPPDMASQHTRVHCAPALARLVHTAMQYVSMRMRRPVHSAQNAAYLLGVLDEATKATTTLAQLAALAWQGAIQDGSSNHMMMHCTMRFDSDSNLQGSKKVEVLTG
jgi:hypothetical protein